MTKYKLPKIEELFDAGVHIGHQAKRWHPKMEPYIYSAENKVHIFDLEQTEQLIKKACEFLHETAKTGGQIIFVGTKRQASKVIKEAALKSGALFVSERWLGGTVTNYKMIKKNIDKLVSYKRKREEGGFQKYTKKERLLLDREIEKLEKNVGGIVNLKGTPQAVVVIDPRKEKTVIREAVLYKVPVIALIDSNTDPTNVDYVIPGNDDAIKSITAVINTLAGAVEEGYKEFAKIAEKDANEAAKTPEVVVEAPAEDLKPLTIKTEVVEEIDVEQGDLSKAGENLEAISDNKVDTAAEAQKKTKK